MSTTELTIPYKRKHQRINLILGLAWLTIGLINFFVDEREGWLSYLWLLLGVIYISMYYLQQKGKYISIKNGVLKLGGPFDKSIMLNEVKQIRHFAGEYILKTENKSFTIPIEQIENDALLELSDFLKSLDVEWS